MIQNINERITDKFGRIFSDLDEVKQRVAKIEVRDETAMNGKD